VKLHTEDYQPVAASRTADSAERGLMGRRGWGLSETAAVFK